MTFSGLDRRSRSQYGTPTSGLAVWMENTMRPEHSPFPCKWWGTGLEDVGLEAVRPDLGTYGQYEFTQLPPVPFSMCGDLGWLAAAQPHDSDVGEEKAAANAQALAELQKSCQSLGLCLPPVFTKFMETGALQRRVRSNTDCFLDLCPALVRSPLGGGYVVRFLADSQGCLFWYLYITEDGSDHAVVCSPGYYGTEAEQWDNEAPDPGDIVFSAESFETFLCRFWLENEIWFAEYEKTPMPEVGLTYIKQYRRNHA